MLILCKLIRTVALPNAFSNTVTLQYCISCCTAVPIYFHVPIGIVFHIVLQCQILCNQLLMHFMLFYSANHYLPTFIVFHVVLQSGSLNTCNCICIVLQCCLLHNNCYCISCCIAVPFITYPLLLYYVLYCSAV